MSPAADALFEALRQAESLRGETAAIKSANDPSRSLEELQARVQSANGGQHSIGYRASICPKNS
jgi:hypothetical protein